MSREYMSKFAFHFMLLFGTFIVAGLSLTRVLEGPQNEFFIEGLILLIVSVTLIAWDFWSIRRAP